jgi:hypothetical protein
VRLLIRTLVTHANCWIRAAAHITFPLMHFEQRVSTGTLLVQTSSTDQAFQTDTIIVSAVGIGYQQQQCCQLLAKH